MSFAAVAPIELNLGPVAIDIQITRRDSFPFGFILTQNGTPIDLTGSSAILTVNPSPTGSQPDLFAVPNINTPDATGVFTFQPTVLDLTQSPGDYRWDSQWTDALGDPRTYASGLFRILPDISE